MARTIAIVGLFGGGIAGVAVISLALAQEAPPGEKPKPPARTAEFLDEAERKAREAEALRLAEEKRAADEKRRAEATEELLREAGKAGTDAEAKQAEEERKAAEARRAEEAKKAEAARKAEEERRAAEAVEAARKAEAGKRADEAKRAAEAERKRAEEEAARRVEEARRTREAADEAMRREDDARRAKEAEEARRVDEALRALEARRAKEAAEARRAAEALRARESVRRMGEVARQIVAAVDDAMLAAEDGRFPNGNGARPKAGPGAGDDGAALEAAAGRFAQDDRSEVVHLYIEARDAFEDRRYGDAIRIYGEIERRAPEARPDVLNNLALAHRAAGEVEQGLTCARRAVAAAPTEAIFHNTYGLMLLAAGLEAEAGAAFDKATWLSGTYVSPHVNLAWIAARRGDLQAAEVRLARALALDPGHATAHLQFAQVRERQDRTDQAGQHYREYLRRADPRGETYRRVQSHVRRFYGE